jgi:hypothetical protein
MTILYIKITEVHYVRHKGDNPVSEAMQKYDLMQNGSNYITIW